MSCTANHLLVRSFVLQLTYLFARVPQKVSTESDNRPVVDLELENERDDCAAAASVRSANIWMIKSGHFRAVEYKATSSKNFKERKEIKGTQPSSQSPWSRSPTPSPPASQSSSQVSPKPFDSCADGLRRFLTDLFYIRSVAIDWICCN